MNESKMNLYLVDNSDYYPGIQILLGSCSLYSKEELAEYVKEWSKILEEKRDEAIQDYKKMINSMRNKIIKEIKNDYSQDELERKLEEYIDENILDENVDGLTVDDFLKINAFKILRENVGSHYNSIEDMDVKAWEKITKEYKVEPLFNKLKERIKELKEIAKSYKDLIFIKTINVNENISLYVLKQWGNKGE